MKKKLSVMVVYNLPEKPGVSGAAESDIDTVESAEMVQEALIGAGYRTDMLGIDVDDVDKLKKIKCDVVFNLIEWTGGNTKYALRAIDIFENRGLAYTGSGKYGYALTCDKREMKRKFGKFGIPSPGYCVVEDKKRMNLKKLRYPAIIKPTFEHCGIAIDQTSVVYDEKQARAKAAEIIDNYNQPALVEEYIDGRELHVTVLEKKGKPWVIPPAEVVFKRNEGLLPILTYKAKWLEDASEYSESTMVPAELDRKTQSRISEVAKVCYLKLGGRDYPRLDMRMDRSGRVFVLEINNNPGIDYDGLSGIGVSARLAGMTFEELASHIVENAYYRFVSGERYAAL